jgi:hypothetical protein
MQVNYYFSPSSINNTVNEIQNEEVNYDFCMPWQNSNSDEKS